MAASINKDLQRILNWGKSNLVCFNAAKTQGCLVSAKKSRSLPVIEMNESVLKISNSISMLGMSVSSNLSWVDHILTATKVAARKLGFLYRSKQYFNSKQLYLLYKAQIRPHLEYNSHLWVGAPKYASDMVNRIQKRAIRLINDPTLTSNIQSLEHRRIVSVLSLFYRYYHGRCASELKSLIPPNATFARNTRFAHSQHQYAVKISSCRTKRTQSTFFCTACKLWNDLPSSCFPSQYNLSKFKVAVHKH